MGIPLSTSTRWRMLRRAALSVCCLFGATTVAQQPDQAEMQQMLEQAQVLQACFAKADQNALAALRTQGTAIAGEMKAMCTAGKREAAQARAIEFAQEMAASPAVKALSECGEMAKTMLMPFIQPRDDGQSLHVCDAAF